MKNIVLHLELMKGMRSTPLAYVVWHHVKVAHISPGFGTYLNLDKEMTTRAPIIGSKSSLIRKPWIEPILTTNAINLRSAMSSCIRFS